MRVHFHLKDGTDVIHDPTGVEVSDLDEARAQAFRAVEELRHEDQLAAQGWSGWRLEATDGSGRVLFSLDLADYTSGRRPLPWVGTLSFCQLPQHRFDVLSD
jgi:hypothetical protein